MTDIELLCKTLVEHINNGDLMIALDFFENTLAPYHSSMDDKENVLLYEQVSILKTHVNEESWNEALSVVDTISEILNG